MLLQTKLSTADGMPDVVKDAINIFEGLTKPLLNYCVSFGTVFQIETMREGLAEDAEEIAALQAEVRRA